MAGVFQVLAINASDIVEKDAVKKLWRLRDALDIFSLTCSQFKITGQSTGENLKNFTLLFSVLGERKGSNILSV